MPPGSYTTSLFEKGTDTILKKVGEESSELIVAAKGGDRDEITYEAADLLLPRRRAARQSGRAADRCLRGAAQAMEMNGAKSGPPGLEIRPSLEEVRELGQTVQPHTGLPQFHLRSGDAGLGLPETAARSRIPSCWKAPSRASASGAIPSWAVTRGRSSPSRTAS